MAGKDWTREQTVRLIRSLKRHEVLWNSRSKSYKARKEKEIAWSNLENDVKMPVNECKRRVESLLAACRREKNKIMRSKSVDSPLFVYQPKWIYWKELGFITGVPENNTCAKDDSNTITKDDEQGQHWAPSSRRPVRKRKKQQQKGTHNQKELKAEQNQQGRQDTNTVVTQDNITPIRYQWDGDEYDAYGITVAAKLRKMDPKQRLIAENIINQTLYKGMLSQLLNDESQNLLQNQKHGQHQEMTQYNMNQNHFGSTNMNQSSVAIIEDMDLMLTKI